MQICFVDNSPEYASFIQKETGWSVTTVCDEAKLNDAVTHNFDAWVIGLSLNWGNRYYTSFYGFAIIRRLRVEYKIRAPFVCFSFLPDYWFYKEQIKDSNVLNWFGHQFLQLPFNGVQVKDVVKLIDPPLTEFHLAELAYACYSPIGIIEEQFHNLSNLTSNIKNFTEAAYKSLEIIKKQVCINDQAYIHSIFENLISKANQSNNYIEKNNIAENIQLTFEPKNLAAFDKKDVTHAKENIQKLFKENQQIVPFTIKPLPWYVLFVDDEEHIRKQIETRLKQYGLNCITAESYEKACEILNNDFKGKWVHNGKIMPPNSISVLISDLRFIENGHVVYNQGYQLLSDVYHQKLKTSNMPFNFGFLSLFLLTSNSGALERLMNTRSPFKAFYYDKEILDIQKVFIRFARHIFDEGIKIHDAVHQKPSLTSWSEGSKSRVFPSLAYFYRMHRMNPDYEDKELFINKKVQTFIPKIIDVIEKKANSVETLSLKSKIIKDKKDAENNFYNILIGRRIALALTQIKDEYTAAVISDVLHDGKLDPTCSVVDSEIMSTYLSFPVNIKSDIPGNLLIEEINWLQSNNYL